MNRIVVNGRDLLLTGDHPVLTSNGQRPAAKIAKADYLFIDGQWLTVNANEAIAPAVDQEVWNVELDADEQDANHWLEANGMAVGDLWMLKRLVIVRSWAQGFFAFAASLRLSICSTAWLHLHCRQQCWSFEHSVLWRNCRGGSGVVSW